MNTSSFSLPAWLDITHAAIVVPTTTILAYLQAKGLIPEGSLILGVVLMVTIDTITGVWAANKRKLPLRSKKFGGVVTKLVLYLLVLEAITIVAMLVPPSDVRTWVQAAPVMALAMRELWSITENVNVIRPGLIPGYVRDKIKDYNDYGKMNDSIKEEPKQ
jgi:phage-related holin